MAGISGNANQYDNTNKLGGVPLFTLSVTAGLADVALDIGVVPKRGTLNVRFLSNQALKAITAGTLKATAIGGTTSVALSAPASLSTLTNSIATYAVGTGIIGAVIDVASAQVAVATLTQEVIKLRNDYANLAAFVHANVTIGMRQ